MSREETSIHEACVARLSAWLDDDLLAAERAEVERHLGACAECAGVAADLELVRERARSLRPTAPPRDLWPEIRSRLGEAEVVPLPVTGPPPARRRVFRFTGPQLAAAGLALALATGAAGWSVAAMGAGGSQRPVQVGADLAGDGESSRVALDGDAASLTDGLEGLEAALREGRGTLDPNTLRLLEKNLAVIERAIAESRAALEVDPGNDYLEGHLRNALASKRAYLEEAVRLVTWSD